MEGEWEGVEEREGDGSETVKPGIYEVLQIADFSQLPLANTETMACKKIAIGLRTHSLNTKDLQRLQKLSHAIPLKMKNKQR